MTQKSDQDSYPDPPGFALVWLPGSGSVSGSVLKPVRIHNTAFFSLRTILAFPDPDLYPKPWLDCMNIMYKMKVGRQGLVLKFNQSCREPGRGGHTMYIVLAPGDGICAPDKGPHVATTHFPHIFIIIAISILVPRGCHAATTAILKTRKPDYTFSTNRQRCFFGREGC